MELIVLVDNNTLTDQYYLGEPAASYYINDNENKILFDTGYSDIFLKNAKLMNVDANNIDGIVISHGHEDHANGLKCFLDNNKKIKLYAHPLAFNKKEINNEMICSPYSLSLLNECFSVIVSKEPYKISEKLIFLGEIPTTFDYEKRYSIGNIKIDDEYKPDYLFDDTALVYKGEEGLFIITGCSHSGICNIIEYAKQVCNDNRVYGVIGGFHLGDDAKVINETIQYFKENNIKMILPCHCTSLYAKAKFINEMPNNVQEVGVGFKITIK